MTRTSLKCAVKISLVFLAIIVVFKYLEYITESTYSNADNNIKYEKADISAAYHGKVNIKDHTNYEPNLKDGKTNMDDANITDVTNTKDATYVSANSRGNCSGFSKINRIRQTCLSRGWVRSTENLMTLKFLRVDDKHKIIYCPINNVPVKPILKLVAMDDNDVHPVQAASEKHEKADYVFL